MVIEKQYKILQRNLGGWVKINDRNWISLIVR